MIALKLILKIVIAPVILLLTLAIWICVGLVYVSGLVLGLLSTVIALLGVAVLITYSPQNGLILLVIAFLISPFGLPKLAFWLLGKVQDLKYAIQDLVYGESEQQVIERLGAPKEFVINTEEQFGVDHASVKKRRGIIH